MATFLSGHQSIFWDLLFTSGLWAKTGKISAEKNQITIISPWITDISTQSSGWPDELLKHACSSENPPNSLSEVLINLMKMNFKVRVVTLDRESKWMDKSNSKMLKNESDFLKSIHDFGAICERRSDMHYKWLNTPVGLWKGSSNATANGLFGRLEEQNDAYYSIANPDQYADQTNIMNQAIKLSQNYFDKFPSMESADILFKNNYSTKKVMPKRTNFDYGHIRQNNKNSKEFDHDFIPPDYISTSNNNSGNSTLKNNELKSIQVWINRTIQNLKRFIDDIFSNAAFLYRDYQRWSDMFSVIDEDGKIIKIKESPMEDFAHNLEEVTSHEILSGIKNNLHILQCCGLSISNGKISKSEGFDPNGFNYKDVYMHTLAKYSPIHPRVNRKRVEDLFELIYNFSTNIFNIDEINFNVDDSNRIESIIYELENKYIYLLDT